MNNLVCEFCNKQFKYSSYLEKHNCKHKIRHEESLTPRGQSAYSYYRDWFRLKELTKPDLKTFLESRYYNTFMIFSDFCKQMGINDTNIYIKFMLSKSYEPTLWTNNQVFKEYLQYCLVNIQPADQVEITIKWLDKYAGNIGCSIKEVIDKLEHYEIMEGIRQRKFLPWYFLHSPKFANKLKRFTKDQIVEFNNIIDSVYWKFQLNNNPQLRKEILEITKQIET